MPTSSLRPMTRDEEINALLFARHELLHGAEWWCQYICVYVNRYAREIDASSFQLTSEIAEFLDGSSTVDGWLNVCTLQIPNRYRIAIIDTLLARRGWR